MVVNMSRSPKKARGSHSPASKSAATQTPPAHAPDGPIDFSVRYAEACGLAAQGKHDDACGIYAELDAALSDVGKETGTGRKRGRN